MGAATRYMPIRCSATCCSRVLRSLLQRRLQRPRLQRLTCAMSSLASARTGADPIGAPTCCKLSQSKSAAASCWTECFPLGCVVDSAMCMVTPVRSLAGAPTGCALAAYTRATRSCWASMTISAISPASPHPRRRAAALTDVVLPHGCPSGI